MNHSTRLLLPAVSAGIVMLCSGCFAYLRNTIVPIPQMEDAAFAAYQAENAPFHAALSSESGTPAEALLPEDLPETGYLLKLNGNTLYVYPEGSREPSAAYDLPADWLPDYDRILLEYGFRVSGQAELRELLEDYIS